MRDASPEDGGGACRTARRRDRAAPCARGASAPQRGNPEHDEAPHCRALRTGGEYLRGPAQWTEQTLERRTAELRRRGIKARWRVQVGVPFEEIVKIAAEERVDMIALGTHGRGGVSRWLLGSVADRVIHSRRAPCSRCGRRPPRRAGDERWLRDPSAQRPNARMPTLELSEQQVKAVAAFLASLRSEAGGRFGMSRGIPGWARNSRARTPLAP